MSTQPTKPEPTGREDAMRNVTVLDLQQPLVRFLTDEELAKLGELTVEMRSTLRVLGHDAADVYVLATLEAALRNEGIRREAAIEEARIALEANAHEAFINRDAVKHRQDGAGLVRPLFLPGGDHQLARHPRRSGRGRRPAHRRPWRPVVRRGGQERLTDARRREPRPRWPGLSRVQSAH